MRTSSPAHPAARRRPRSRRSCRGAPVGWGPGRSARRGGRRPRRPPSRVALPIALEPGAARRLALVIAGARVGLGLVAVVTPTVVARPWIGEEAGQVGAKVLGRALAGRDLALGLGPLLAGRRRRSLRSWVQAGALADLVDTGATLVAFGRLPRRGRWAVLASAGGAAAAGTLAARSL